MSKWQKIIAGINWKRGVLRLWTLFSMLWCVFVLILLSNRSNIDWSFSADRIVHVKFSNTETWDYPAEWGIPRIEVDLKRRIDELNQQNRDWLATIPAEQKAACGAGTKDRFGSSMRDIDALKRDVAKGECDKIFWATAGDLVVPSGWEGQISDAPLSFWRAIPKLAPWVIGPPLGLLALGAG